MYSFEALIICIFLCLNFVSCYDWSKVDAVLEREMNLHTYPGCLAAVVSNKGVIYKRAVGNFTYGVVPPHNQFNPPMDFETTKFDLASLTKVLATTTALMVFYQNGEVDLDSRVTEYLGTQFGMNGKEAITIRNLLLHDAGFPADPSPGYSTAKFPCPQNTQPHPQEVFTCQSQVYSALMHQKLINPVGSTYIYSDLSMITGMYVVGNLAMKYRKVNERDLRPACVAGLRKDAPEIAQCYYEAFLDRYVFGLKMKHSGFLPKPNEWHRVPPTWNDDYYRHMVLQGQVSDENCYALGGISGHAGLFAPIGDVIDLASSIMWAPASSTFINQTTAKYFTTMYNVSQSSRALGWDTNNYQKNTYRGCGNLSATTWTHTGYTGTQVCGDPERGIVTILLTNRCYPDKTKTLPDIQRARKEFNNAVREAIDNAAMHQ